MAAVIALAVVGLHIWDLTLYPLVTDDEVLLNEPARVLVAAGTIESPLLSTDHKLDVALVQPPVQTLAVSVVYLVAGFGMWQTRFASVCWAALSAAVIFAVATRWSSAGARAGVVAALLLTLHPAFNISARIGRMDALAIAFMLASYHAYRIGDEDRYKTGTTLASGVLAALACLTHFVCFGFVAAMLVVLAFRDHRRARTLVVFCAGGICIALLGFLFALGQGDYLNQLFGHGAMRSAEGSPWSRLTDELTRWAVDARRSPGLYATWLAAGGYTFLRRPSIGRYGYEIGLIALVMFMFNAMLMSKVSGLYPLYVASFLILFAVECGVAASRSSGGGRKAAQAAVATAVLTGLPALLIPRLVAATAQRTVRAYEPTADRLHALVPAGATVWSVPEGWYALAEDRSVRTPSLHENHGPNPAVDDFAVGRAAEPVVMEGFIEVARIGEPIPPVMGRTFATTDYRFIVYRSTIRENYPERGDNILALGSP
jgi:4-amino-4-deoxy-L-arabinose transferase-like glycosyltransferase